MAELSAVRYHTRVLENASGAARAFVERERSSVPEHRAAILGKGALPLPKQSPPGTFLHGFLLPFSLIAATLRHPTLGRPYLRIALLRAVAVAVAVVVLALLTTSRPEPQRHIGTDGTVHIRRRHEKGANASANFGDGVHVHHPGVHVDITDETQKVTLFGQNLEVVVDDDSDDPAETRAREAKGSVFAGVSTKVARGWSWVLWLVGIVSAAELGVVFVSGLWDDWLAFHASGVARIRPEEDTPRPPKLTFELRSLFKKVKRRLRGYIVFAAGIPILFPFRFLPTVGHALFAVSVTLWGWYWLGVFTAAKSAHAWADRDTAESPFFIRELRDRSVGHSWLKPIHWYGRLWARATGEMNAAASVFERSPRAFLGLALARVILSTPGVYLLARPVIPLAAGRLTAETDPSNRFCESVTNPLT